MATINWDKPTIDLELKFSLQTVLNLLIEMSDQEAEELIIEYLCRNETACKVVEKWLTDNKA